MDSKDFMATAFEDYFWEISVGTLGVIILLTVECCGCCQLLQSLAEKRRVNKEIALAQKLIICRIKDLEEGKIVPEPVPEEEQPVEDTTTQPFAKKKTKKRKSRNPIV